MTVLQLNTTKAGEPAAKFSLNLKKAEPFKVTLSWDGDGDLDLHAFRCVNSGQGAKVSAYEDILSTYNVRRNIRGQEVGTLDKKADGSFSVYGGAMNHSPDATDGNAADIDEFITIDPTRLPSVPSGSHTEIPLIAMIHPQSAGMTFSRFKNAGITVTGDDGRELLKVNLSNEFGQFVGVQIGAILISDAGVEFAQVGVGFSDDFNAILGFFA